MKCIACFVLLLWVGPAFAQSGCPDPQATNFNPLATSNDGSCIYPLTTFTPVFKTNLSGSLKEISGFTKANSKWWGHNDSGASETFYSINPGNGVVNQTIELKNAKNRDWEEIASDSLHLYLGDFGNNSNNRQNLGIYMVPLTAIGNSATETVQESEWSFLPFSYEDQTSFAAMPEDSSVFDCEAMITHHQKIHLFSKTRRNYNTVHYIINPATQTAEKAEVFDAQGLITGAAISPNRDLIVLVGYDLRPFIPTVFCWLLWDWPPNSDAFFSGNKRRIELGSALLVGQVESVGFDSDRTAFITNERTDFNGVTLVPESVRALDFSAWVPGLVSTNEFPGAQQTIQVYPNPFSQMIHFQYAESEKPDFINVKNLLGQTVLSLKEVPQSLDLSFLTPGYYTFEFWKNGRQTAQVTALKQ